MARVGASPPLPALRRTNTEPSGRALPRLIWGLNTFVSRLTDRAWSGQDQIPRTGGVVFVVNHISHFDPIAVGQFLAFSGRWPHFLGKASLFRLPVVGAIIRAAEQIPVERESRAAAGALAAAVSAVERGKAVIIYPEGTITLDPDLWPMAGRTGASRVALQTGCPVIPVGQWGAQQVMYGKRLGWPRFRPRATLTLKAGDPIPLEDLRAGPLTAAALREATDRIMAAITALVAEVRGEPAPAVRLNPRTALQEET